MPPPAVHLLSGEEALLRERRLFELVSAYAPKENPEYNQETHRGPELDLDRVVGGCEMLPVFGDRRLVVVRHLDLKAAAAHAGFVGYLRRPNPSTVLLLETDGLRANRAEGEATDRTAKSKSKGISVKELLQLIPKREEFGALKNEDAVDWVRRVAKERGFEIAGNVCRELVELVGTDAGRLEDEVEKAALLAGTKPRIGLTEIEALARRTRSHTMFELTDGIALGDRREVLRHLHALLDDGGEPVALVGMICWHLRRTLRGAAEVEAGRPAADAARAASVWNHADRFAATCRRLGTRGAARALRALGDADRRLKSSGEADRLVLERTLLELLPRG